MPLAKQTLALLAKALQSLALGVLIGTLAYASLEVASAYFQNFRMERALARETRLAAADLRPASAIQDELFRKSQSLGLPIEKSAFQIRSVTVEAPVVSLSATVDPGAGPKITGNVAIAVSYTVPVHFPLHTLRLNFRLGSGADSL